MSEEKPKLHAKWTDDCSGKKDYDGPVIAVSTRYWSDHTATCSIDILDNGSPDDFPDHYSLIERDFKGGSFEDVSSQVEKWAQEQMDRVVAAVRREFYVDPNGSPR